MASAPVRGRIATQFAVGLLTLDGVLLLAAGLWGHRRGPVLGGVVCLAGALLVLWWWRRHRRSLAELAQARREVRDELQALRDLLRR